MLQAAEELEEDLLDDMSQLMISAPTMKMDGIFETVWGFRFRLGFRARALCTCTVKCILDSKHPRL